MSNRKQKRSQEKLKAKIAAKANKVVSKTQQRENEIKAAAYAKANDGQAPSKDDIASMIGKHIDLSKAKKTEYVDGKVKYSIPIAKDVVEAEKLRRVSSLTDKNGKLNKEAYLAKFYEAQALVQKENLSKATPILVDLLKVMPTDTGVLKQLGMCSEKLKNYESAISFFESALKIEPEDDAVRCAIGALLGRIDRLDEGVEIIQNVLKKGDMVNKITRSEAHGALGNIYSILGEEKIATEHLTKACDLNPNNMDNLYNLATQNKYIKDPSSKYFKMIKKLEQKNPFGDDARMNTLLNYALFDCYDQMKEHETAFDYALKGAEFKSKQMTYETPEELDLGFKSITDFFSEDLIHSDKITGCQSDSPIFVLGMPRSGTTLLEQIVLSHPDMEGVGEDALIGHLIKNYSFMKPHNNAPYPLRTHTAGEEYLTPELVGKNYVDYLSKKHPDAKKIINKSIGNFFWVGYLAIALPKAKFIHIKRNAMDSCISSFSKNFTDTAQSYSYDLETLGTHYRNYVELMDYWSKVLPDRILTVNYEDLVEDLEGEARRIIEFLELPWDNQCLEFYKTKSTVRTASVAQVRKPIYKSSIGRWKRYGTKVAPLITALGHAAPLEAKEYLIKIKAKKHNAT